MSGPPRQIFIYSLFVPTGAGDVLIEYALGKVLATKLAQRGIAAVANSGVVKYFFRNGPKIGQEMTEAEFRRLYGEHAAAAIKQLQDEADRIAKQIAEEADNIANSGDEAIKPTLDEVAKELDNPVASTVTLSASKNFNQQSHGGRAKQYLEELTGAKITEKLKTPGGTAAVLRGWEEQIRNGTLKAKGQFTDPFYPGQVFEVFEGGGFTLLRSLDGALLSVQRSTFDMIQRLLPKT